MARRPKIADLDVPERAKEALLNLCGGEPFAMRRVVTMQDFLDWADDEISGRVCIRETGIGEVTLFLPRCTEDVINFYADSLSNIVSAFLSVKFKAGIWRYLWNCTALWIRGR